MSEGNTTDGFAMLQLPKSEQKKVAGDRSGRDEVKKRKRRKKRSGGE